MTRAAAKLEVCSFVIRAIRKKVIVTPSNRISNQTLYLAYRLGRPAKLLCGMIVLLWISPNPGFLEVAGKMLDVNKSS